MLAHAGVNTTPPSAFGSRRICVYPTGQTEPNVSFLLVYLTSFRRAPHSVARRFDLLEEPPDAGGRHGGAVTHLHVRGGVTFRTG